MKLLTLLSLSITAPLLLTGCASVPSIEEQTKLIEYEKCLEHLENTRLAVQAEILSKWGGLQGNPTSELLDKRLQVLTSEGKELPRFDIQIERCAPYRP